MEFYVYMHRRATNGIPFYIGKGKKKRAWDTKRSKFWTRIAKKHGVIVEIIEAGLDEKTAFEREIFYIAQHRKTLCNQTDGGTGGDLFRFVDREKHKASINLEQCSRGGKIGGAKGSAIGIETQRRMKLGFFDSKLQSILGKRGGAANRGISRSFNTVACPHCGVIGKDCAMYRWHFDKCKKKP